jgi:hypothetical protein
LPQAAIRLGVRVSDRAAPINAEHARRQLAAPQFIPDEPRRATYAAIDLMVAELPYGFWKDATGRVVLFNRGYLPIWQRFADGEIRRANAGEWVRWIEERWFDATRIRYEKHTRERLREILRSFLQVGIWRGSRRTMFDTARCGHELISKAVGDCRSANQGAACGAGRRAGQH